MAQSSALDCHDSHLIEPPKNCFGRQPDSAASGIGARPIQEYKMMNSVIYAIMSYFNLFFQEGRFECTLYF